MIDLKNWRLYAMAFHVILGACVWYAAEKFGSATTNMVVVSVGTGILIYGILVWRWWWRRRDLPDVSVNLVHLYAANARTYFFPGNGNIIAQFARYTTCLPDISHANAGDLFPPPVSGMAQPYDVWTVPWPRFMPTQLFDALYYLATGVRRTSLFVTPLQRLLNLVPAVPLPWRVNVAQEPDVVHALAGVRAAIQRLDPGERLVLFGTSRGAAVALQVAARLTPVEIQTRVACLVLEGVFDSSQRVLATRRFSALWTTVARWMCPMYRADDTEACEAPLRAAQQFPHRTLPILVVTSRADTLVRVERSRAIYDALVAAGVLDLTLLVLAKSSHSGYATEDAYDRAAYVKVLDALYERAF